MINFKINADPSSDRRGMGWATWFSLRKDRGNKSEDDSKIPGGCLFQLIIVILIIISILIVIYLPKLSKLFQSP